jgi:hypothetical protein
MVCGKSPLFGGSGKLQGTEDGRVSCEGVVGIYHCLTRDGLMIYRPWNKDGTGLFAFFFFSFLFFFFFVFLFFFLRWPLFFFCTLVYVELCFIGGMR